MNIFLKVIFLFILGSLCLTGAGIFSVSIYYVQYGCVEYRCSDTIIFEEPDNPHCVYSIYSKNDQEICNKSVPCSKITTGNTKHTKPAYKSKTITKTCWNHKLFGNISETNLQSCPILGLFCFDITFLILALSSIGTIFISSYTMSCVCKENHTHKNDKHTNDLELHLDDYSNYRDPIINPIYV